MLLNWMGHRNSLFGHNSPNVSSISSLASVEPELKTFLQFLLWRIPIYSSSATVDQSLLNIQYKEILLFRPEASPKRPAWSTISLSNHVFCYYCLKSHTFADVLFTCPKRGADAGAMEPIRRTITAEFPPEP